MAAHSRLDNAARASFCALVHTFVTRSWSDYSGLVDLVLSEATAADVIPGTWPACWTAARRCPRAQSGPAVRVLVASANSELCQTIAEACAAAGYPVERQTTRRSATGPSPLGNGKPSRSGETLLTVWDVPVLEEWTERLTRHAQHPGPIVGLMGFPDRNMVAAKSKGAIACLELPLNLDDLIDVIERFASSLARDPHAADPRRTTAHAPSTPTPRARRSRTSTNPTVASPAPDAYNCRSSQLATDTRQLAIDASERTCPRRSRIRCRPRRSWG